MSTLSGLINQEIVSFEKSALVDKVSAAPQSDQPNLLRRFAAHKVAPAIVHYISGALVFSGAALFCSGMGILPGIILMSIGTALFISGTAIATCNLPDDIGTGDYVEFSGQCFVWGICFILTFPTILLLKISIHFSTAWLLQDENSDTPGHAFSSDLSWLMAPPTKDNLPDSLGFSGLEVA